MKNRDLIIKILLRNYYMQMGYIKAKEIVEVWYSDRIISEKQMRTYLELLCEWDEKNDTDS